MNLGCFSQVTVGHGLVTGRFGWFPFISHGLVTGSRLNFETTLLQTFSSMHSFWISCFWFMKFMTGIYTRTKTMQLKSTQIELMVWHGMEFKRGRSPMWEDHAWRVKKGKAPKHGMSIIDALKWGRSPMYEDHAWHVKKSGVPHARRSRSPWKKETMPLLMTTLPLCPVVISPFSPQSWLHLQDACY